MAANSMNPQAGRAVAIGSFLVGLFGLGVSLEGLLTGEPVWIVFCLALMGLIFIAIGWVWWRLAASAQRRGALPSPPLPPPTAHPG
jgi:hypothetical protein